MPTFKRLNFKFISFQPFERKGHCSTLLYNFLDGQLGCLKEKLKKKKSLLIAVVLKNVWYPILKSDILFYPIFLKTGWFEPYIQLIKLRHRLAKLASGALSLISCKVLFYSFLSRGPLWSRSPLWVFVATVLPSPDPSGRDT